MIFESVFRLYWIVKIYHSKSINFNIIKFFFSFTQMNSIQIMPCTNSTYMPLNITNNSPWHYSRTNSQKNSGYHQSSGMNLQFNLTFLIFSIEILSFFLSQSNPQYNVVRIASKGLLQRLHVKNYQKLKKRTNKENLIRKSYTHYTNIFCHCFYIYLALLMIKKLRNKSQIYLLIDFS